MITNTLFLTLLFVGSSLRTTASSNVSSNANSISLDTLLGSLENSGVSGTWDDESVQSEALEATSEATDSPKSPEPKYCTTNKIPWACRAHFNTLSGPSNQPKNPAFDDVAHPRKFDSRLYKFEPIPDGFESYMNNNYEKENCNSRNWIPETGICKECEDCKDDLPSFLEEKEPDAISDLEEGGSSGTWENGNGGATATWVDKSAGATGSWNNEKSFADKCKVAVGKWANEVSGGAQGVYELCQFDKDGNNWWSKQSACDKVRTILDGLDSDEAAECAIKTIGAFLGGGLFKSYYDYIKAILQIIRLFCDLNLYLHCGLTAWDELQEYLSKLWKSDKCPKCAKTFKYNLKDFLKCSIATRSCRIINWHTFSALWRTKDFCPYYMIKRATYAARQIFRCIVEFIENLLESVATIATSARKIHESRSAIQITANNRLKNRKVSHVLTTCARRELNKILRHVGQAAVDRLLDVSFEAYTQFGSNVKFKWTANSVESIYETLWVAIKKAFQDGIEGVMEGMFNCFIKEWLAIFNDYKEAVLKELGSVKCKSPVCLLGKLLLCARHKF